MLDSLLSNIKNLSSYSIIIITYLFCPNIHMKICISISVNSFETTLILLLRLCLLNSALNFLPNISSTRTVHSDCLKVYLIHILYGWLHLTLDGILAFFFKFSFTLVFKDGFINLVSFGLIVKVIHDPKVNSREQGVQRMGLPPVPCTVNHSIYMISLLGPSFSFTGIPFLCEIQGHSSMWACSHSAKYSQISNGISYTCLAFPSKQHLRAHWPAHLQSCHPQGTVHREKRALCHFSSLILKTTLEYTRCDISCSYQLNLGVDSGPTSENGNVLLSRVTYAFSLDNFFPKTGFLCAALAALEFTL